MFRSAFLMSMLVACGAPEDNSGQQVGYRDGTDGGPNSGERGTVKITEIGWAGSVNDDGDWDPDDIFFEIRNEGTRPMILTDWFVIMEGAREVTWRVPPMEVPLQVGSHLFIAAKTSRCFPEPDLVIPGLDFGDGDPFRLTLRDADERLIEPAGNRTLPVYAGIYDGEVTRSMEKVELIFGGRGSEPESWHHYTDVPVDVPNNDRIADNCRQRTLASPGRPNSPDYSGAFSAGGLD